MDYKKNIFTLEGEWNENPEDKSSVIDMLRFLKNIFGIDYFNNVKSNDITSMYEFLQDNKSTYTGVVTRLFSLENSFGL